MSRAPSFRASTALIVTGFAVIAGVIAFGLGHDLWRPIPGMAPQVSWLMPETTPVRLAALKGAGMPETAALYALIVALCWGLIGALVAGGFAWGVMNKGATVLGVDKALGYLTALAFLYGVSTGLEVLLHLVKITPRGGLHAIPGLWFCAMIPSAAILSRIGALIAHDAGALIAIALAGEPRRLAELVASAEEVRGAKSLEARLARRLAARRPEV
ncbi:hypothetical protein ACFOWB_21320 [Chenggangzhangella methanolivorans]|uniref:hypothetical protein n=2 Tax=Chenggangzhangella methanolivorans TaxID=1437009 RepID=UPI00361DB234